MQNAKDTFYEMLRGRIAALNPYRTLTLRGVVRPGVLVEENELLAASVLPDCFRLRWGAVTVSADGALPLVACVCAIAYETAGTALQGGMDRGRALAAMDAELQAALDAVPRNAPKLNYAGLAGGGAAAAMTTSVWWGELAFGEATANDNRVARTATVSVMSYQEAGEL